MAVSTPPTQLNGHAEEIDAASVPTALSRMRPNGRDRKRAFVPRYIPLSLKTGHALVDQFATMRLDGIMVDRRWMKNPAFCVEKKDEDGVLKKSKLVNLTTVLVFADLVDYYRCPKVRMIGPDGQPSTAAEKKFLTLWLVKSFEQWALELGLSKGQLQDAVYQLKREGLLDYREASKEVRDTWKAGAKNAQRPFEVWPIAKAVKKLCEAEDSPTELAPNLRTDNEVCNELMSLRLRGDVIDFNWLHHPALRHGKEQKIKLTALFVMAHLFYLHSPFEPTDPVTHEPLPMQKRFKNDILSKDYETWAKLAALTEDQLRRAVTFLATKNLIKRWTGTELTVEGYQSNLRAMIVPQFLAVHDLTFGPFATTTERDRALRGAATGADTSRQHLPKFAGTPRQAGLFDAKESPDICRDTPPPVSTSPDICRDSQPIFAGKESRYLPTIIDSPLMPFLDQQQQAQRNETRTGFGGDGFNAKASSTHDTATLSLDAEIKQRQQAVIQQLHDLKTGCASQTIERAARLRVEHAEMWAQHWKSQPEAQVTFWDDYFDRTGKFSNPGAALAKRLDDVAQIPREVAIERIKAKRSADAAERREEAREERERNEREARHKTAYERKAATEVLKRFKMQPESTQQAAIAHVTDANPFLSDRGRGKGPRKLLDEALEGTLDEALLFQLTKSLDSALDYVAKDRPALPGMEQRAAGEEELEEFEAETRPLDPYAESLVEAIQAGEMAVGLVRELSEDVLAGEVEMKNLDHRLDPNYTGAEWQAIKERVQTTVEAMVKATRDAEKA